MNVRNLFVVAFLAVQLILPLRGFWLDKLETRGNFSWNMYSQRYGCRASYFVITPERAVEPVNPRDHFNRPQRASMTYHRDTLPELHRYLCETLEAEGRLGTLRGSMACKLNRQDRVELIEHNGDLCSAPDFGVGRR